MSSDNYKKLEDIFEKGVKNKGTMRVFRKGSVWSIGNLRVPMDVYFSSS